MPTYLYQCRKCDSTFEVDQRITEDPLTDCTCGGKGTVKRLIQPVAVFFNGAGFHVNDYAPKASTPPESAPPAPGPCGSDSCACKAPE